MLQVENYKISNLITAVTKIKQLPGLSYGNVFTFAKIMKFSEDSMKPFYLTVEEIKKEHPQAKGEDGKPIYVPAGNGQMRPVFEEDEAMQVKMAELSNAKTDFIMDSVELTVKKSETWLTVDIVKSFMDVFGEEKFKVNEIEG